MGTSPVVVALTAFLTALAGGGGGGGFGNDHRNWGGGDDGDIAERIIDSFFGNVCVPCKQICGGKMTIQVDIPRVMHAITGLVHAMDAALRKYKNTSLSRYLYTYLTNLINAKLVKKKIPLRHVGIKPIFALAPLLKYDITKGVRIKVLEYVFTECVHYYVPSVKYNVKSINSEIFQNFKPQIMDFLRGGDGDLGPLSAAMIKYVLEKNNLTSFRTDNPACMLCKKMPKSCDAKKKKVKKELMKRVKVAAFGSA